MSSHINNVTVNCNSSRILLDDSSPVAMNAFKTSLLRFEESFCTLIQFLRGIWNPEMMNGLKVSKPKFGLERLFLAWFPANLFVRRSLTNVESLHDYTIAPFPGEIPYHDVEDKMIGSIRMLCLWINVNLLYRLGNHFLIFVKNVINYIEHRGEEPSSVRTPGPNVSPVAENEGQVLSPDDSEENGTAEQKQSESDSSANVPKEEYTSSDDQTVVASGCIVW